MRQIKLSICIPTYNRAPFLEKALSYFVELYKFPFSYEIVVSDNASTDDTCEVVKRFLGEGLPIRYFRQVENFGAEANSLGSYRHALGEYVLYLADDDVLINDGIIEAIRYLDLNIDVGACYGPWYTHDEVEGLDNQPFYSVEKNTKFKKQAFESCFDFLIDGHVFPEIAIFRSSALRSALVRRHFAYWAFSHLSHFLDQGAVAFLKNPFYRQVIRSKITRDRPQAGHAEVLTAWDRYRGGLEYFLYIGAKRGAVDMAPDRRLSRDQQILDFTMLRMTVALRMWFQTGDYVRAYELYTRLMMGGYASHPEVVAARNVLPLLVAVHTLAEQANTAPEVEKLLLHGVDSYNSLAELLREVGLRSQIEIVPQSTELTEIEVGRTAVFVAEARDREHYVRKGHPPNLVLSESDLLSHVLM
ncbi:glycosyltransferase family 2 protein [Ensifer adhaerens]|uniref:glycosyltransferase family 2 protein n=1 Tax=Ensifer adhaerens TaxID=106592 RepID=UPI003D0229D3